MPLITGFPDIGASSTPYAADLNAAAQKFAEVIGGVLPDGTVLPGNVDADNMAADPRFLNEQKAEPYSEFTISSSRFDGLYSSAGGKEFGPLPFDAILTGVLYRGYVAHDGEIALELGGKPLIGLTLDTTELYRAWPLSYLVPAGVLLRMTLTYNPDSADSYFLAAVFKALHRG